MPDPRAELIAGLRAPQASISPKFLHDSLGSKLFEAICELPEYYPTRTEAAVMERYGAEIAAACGVGSTLIDLGAGNCLGIDFSASLALPATVAASRRLFFYPGSSIGNFSPDEARAFLVRLRGQCDSAGGLLLGLDLVKNHATPDAAYDDALGVTAAFNLNVLRHANRLAACDFDLRDWRHRARFNAGQRRIEMHLEAHGPGRACRPKPNGRSRPSPAGQPGAIVRALLAMDQQQLLSVSWVCQSTGSGR